jgi:hypothetical protein
MKTNTIVAGLLGAGMLAFAAPASQAAVYAPSATAPRSLSAASGSIEPVQYWRGGPRYGGGRYAAPGAYWYHRPWVRRPYYGRVIAGVALGTLIAVTAYGVVPRRPAPDLCWYWADPSQTRGYWDYCY